MEPLGLRIFDADNHDDEAEDAFTRYIEPALRKRCMQWAEVDGKKRLLVGGRVNRFIPNPSFDAVAKPGCLETHYVQELKDFSDDEIRLAMRDNALGLSERRRA